MASSYPNALDSLRTNHVDGTEKIFAATTNDLADAVNKIERELGISPSAAYADLVARLDAMQAQINGLSAGSGGGLVHASIRYLKVGGNDASDGLSWANAKAGPQSAYDALPSDGGFVISGPGPYNLGSGLACDRSKTARFCAFTGGRHRRHPLGEGNANVRFYSSSTPTSLVSITGSGPDGHGYEFEGIDFDLSNGIQFGIYAEGLNYLMVKNCGARGRPTWSAPQYLVRCLHGSGGDSSWWRLIENETASGVGLCYFGDPGEGNNQNQHVIAFNTIFQGGGPAIRIIGGHRCVTIGNGIEGDAIGIQLDRIDGSAFLADGGEFTTPFVSATHSSGNVIAPLGIAGVPAQSAKLIVEDSQCENLILAPALVEGIYGQAGQNGETIIDQDTVLGQAGVNYPEVVLTPSQVGVRPKPVTPVTLADVIAVLQKRGLTD